MLTLCTAVALAIAPADVPRPKEGRFIVDAASVMTDAEETSLGRTLGDAHHAHGFTVDVVTIGSTDALAPEKFTRELYDLWHIGGDRDDGALVLLIVDVRRLEFHVGTGLAGRLPDERVAEVRDAIMAPEFDEARYGTGLTRGVRQLVNMIIDPSTPVPKKPGFSYRPGDDQRSSTPPWLLYALAVAGVGIGVLAVAVLGMGRAGWYGDRG